MAKNKNNITVKTQNGININEPYAAQPQQINIPSAQPPLLKSPPYLPNNLATPRTANNKNVNYAGANTAYDLFYMAIKKLYYDNITDPITHTITGCSQLYPDKPGYTRGWIFNGLTPTFAPCGCYVEAIWPIFLGVGLFSNSVSKNIAKNTIIARLRRKCLEDFLHITGGIINKAHYFIYKNWEAIRRLGIDTGFGLAINAGKKAFRVLKIPPVAPGFTRLYRAQDNTVLAQVANALDPKGTGRWFHVDANSAVGYIDPDLIPAAGAQRGWAVKYPNGHLVYVDVPTSSLQTVFHSHPLLTNVSAIDEITGEILSGLDQTRMGVWDINNGGNGKTVIKRLNNVGDEILVYGVPQDTDVVLNPGIFSYTNATALKEVFADTTIANQALKIAACKNLGDIKEFKILIKKIEDFTHIDGYGMFVAPDPSNISGAGMEAAEKWLTDAAYRNKKAEEWKSILAEFQALRAKHLDELPQILQDTINEMETLMDANSPLMATTSNYVNIFGFIFNVLDVTTIVENKKCGPKYYMHSAATRNLRYVGSALTGSIISQLPDISDSDWDLIRNKLIQNEAKTLWAELDDNCECNSCPQEYNLCDKASNFFTDYYNTCEKCQECLNDNFEPIYAENSIKPILLSDKSAQRYRSEPAIGGTFDPEFGNPITDYGCICECESSDIVRRDKDDNLVSRSRKLKDYAPNTGNPFEDSNCYSYTDGPNKVNINIPRYGDDVNPLTQPFPRYLTITPDIGSMIPGIPYETIQERQVCDLSTPPDGLSEYSVFSWLTSAYTWNRVLGMWRCKKIKDCTAPKVFTHGVASNGEYCDCTNVDLSSSSSSSSEIVEPGSFFGCNFENASVNGQYNYFEIYNNHSTYNNGDNIIFYKDANGWVITPFVFDDGDIYNSNILYKNTNENIISSSWIDMSGTTSSSSSQILSSGITQTSNC